MALDLQDKTKLQPRPRLPAKSAWYNECPSLSGLQVLLIVDLEHAAGKAMQEGKKDLLRFLPFQKHFVNFIFNVNTNIVIIYSGSIIHIEFYKALKKCLCVLVYERSFFTALQKYLI